MPLSAGTAVERYVIEGVIGEGAMAVVYRARHRDLGSLHAIKQLTNRDPQISERLVQEGRLQSTLRHQNVLSVTDLVQIDGTPALVMEYVAGPTLRQLLTEETLSLHQADALVQGLLRGVAAAHAHGLVHRDLKPANVLIAVTDNALVPKIADFGLAKLLEGEGSNVQATQTGSAMGTPAYMAPEQIQDSSSVDARADVFALGAILYEIVSGSRCFRGDKILTLWQDICAGRYTPLQERTPDLPPRILKAVEGALITDRDARIGSVNQLIDTWFDGVTESVNVSPSKSREVWPQALRDKTASLASDVAPPDPDASSGSIAFEQTVAAGSTPPTSATMSPAERATEVPVTRPQTRALPKWLWAVAVLLLVAGAWALGRQGGAPETVSPAQPPAQVQAGTAEGTSAQQAPDSAPVDEAASPRPAPLFSLGPDKPERAQRLLDTAVKAIIEGETARAERLLVALRETCSDEAVVHSMLSLTYFFQKRVGLSVTESKWGARLAQDMEGDLGALVVLADRSWREHENKAGLLAQWKTLREAHDDPMVEIYYFAAARHLIGYAPLIDQLDESKKAHPEWIILWLLELRLLEELQDLDGLLKAATAAAQTHPASPGLKIKRYCAMALLGQLEAAEVGLKDVLRQDGGLIGARLVLADIYLRRGLEAERMEQLMLLLSDTTPVTEQLSFLAEHGLSMANHGRLTEANKLWRFCVEAGRKAGHHHSAVICARLGVDAQVWLRTLTADDPWIEEARGFLAEPELDSDVRNLHTLVLLWMQAKLRLEADPADPADAQALLERVKAFPPGSLPFALAGWLVDEITFSLALQAGDEPALRKHLAAQKTQAELAGLGTSCLLEHKRAQAGEVLADGELTLTALTAIAEDRCVPHAFQGVSRALARVALADHHLRQRHTDDAEAQLTAFKEAWPRADEALPVAREAAALSSRL